MKNLPGFCLVTATLTPTKESDIKIEVWLPAENWSPARESEFRISRSEIPNSRFGFRNSRFPLT